MNVFARLSLVLIATSLAACGGDTGTQPSVDPANIIAKISINASRNTLDVGGTLQLTADAANSAGTVLAGKTINWISSRPDIATITAQGLVKGVAPGTVQITGTSGGQTGSVTLTVETPNLITLISDAGDYIGGGATHSYTNTNAIIGAAASTTTIQVGITGIQNWTATFQAPSGAQLTPGTYANAAKWPFQGNNPGLSWDGEGRSCNTFTGSFTVDSLSWSAGPGSSLVALDMHFEQHCDGVIAALRGTIHWRSDDPAAPPVGPTVPIPTNLWQPPTGAVPDTGNVVYLESQQGDYVGQGATNKYQTNITVTASGMRATVSVGGYTGEFYGMNSISQLEVGYYGDVARAPSDSRVQGGLDWSGNGRGCNDLTGWFAVDSVNYVNGVLVGIKLRFEQHCDGQTPALHGMVRWGKLTN
jgi:hypothetical protein